MGLVKPLPAQVAKIKVIGVGGAGMNVINQMIEKGGAEGVEFVAVNTDAQVLLTSAAKIKIQIGEKFTRGLGTGGDPRIGAKAAEESGEKLKQVLTGADMVFITAGGGGGTGTGAAPVIAQIARETLKILTVGVITKPFHFEGTKRMVVAEEGIAKLKEKTDALITIPNQKLLDLREGITFLEAFRLADSVLARAVQGVAEIITMPGLINLDFADVKAIMRNAGSALLGVGTGRGKQRAEKALNEALKSPLVAAPIQGARGVLFNVIGGPDLTMAEINWLAEAITKNVGGDANIIFGARIDNAFKDRLQLVLIATGFDEQAALQELVNDKEKTSQDVSEKKENSSSEVRKKAGKGDAKVRAMLKKLARENAKLGVQIENKLDIPAFLRRA